MAITRRTFIGTGATALAVAPALAAQAQQKTAVTAAAAAAQKVAPKARAGDGKTGKGKTVNFVENSKAVATIVTADEAFPISVYAAQELAYHIELATGAKLPVVTESKVIADGKPRIYVGATKAAQKLEIKAASLPPEHCLLRTQGNNLFIAGNDGPGHALETENIHSGTLWGVYEVLERTLDARWLWPGEGGIVVNKTATLGVPAWNEMLQPHLLSRVLRTYVPWNNGDPFIFDATSYGYNSGLAYSSVEALKQHLIDQQIFLRRQRMGMSQVPNLSVGHNFIGWWGAFGKEHPEWFQLIPVAEGEFAGKPQQERARMAYGRPESTWKGKRGPDDPANPYAVSMCVSNTEFHAQIIRLWQEERKKNPGKDIPVMIGENDIWALCICDKCRALDAPQKPVKETRQLPGSVPGLYYPFDAGRRYAWFYQQIHRLASQVDPQARVLAYVYLNYFVAPKDIKLHPNVVLNFVPWGGFWYPRDPREQVWLRDQWLQWHDMDASLLFRPNYVLDGGSLPLNYHHQQTDQFDFYLKNGCIGTDFDARVGQWSAQGATLYSLLRKHTRPEKSAELLLEEFYTAFGPAAPHIKAYFDFWEAHCEAALLIAPDTDAKTRAAMEEKEGLVGTVFAPGVFERHQATNLLTYTRVARELYPETAFARAEAILQAAQKAVGTDKALLARVEYIYNGWRHAQKVAVVSGVFEDKTTSTAQRRAALEDLVKFRRATEGMNIANYAQSAGDELRAFGDRYDFGTTFKLEEKPADTVYKG